MAGRGRRRCSGSSLQEDDRLAAPPLPCALPALPRSPLPPRPRLPRIGFPSTASSGPGRSSEQPQVAVNASGDAVAVSGSRANVLKTIEASTHVSGSSWSQPVELSGAAIDATDPQVAIDSAGNAVAIWEGEGPSTAIGLTVSHTFQGPGTYRVTVDVADAAGNTTSESGEVMIAAAPSAPSPPAVPPLPGAHGCQGQRRRSAAR